MFTIDWNGYGETSQTVSLNIWNFNSSAWEELDNDTFTAGTDGDLTGFKLGMNYVSSNIVWAWVKGTHVTGGSGQFTDRIKLTVTKSPNSAPTAPTSLFTNESTYGAQTGYVSAVAVGDTTPVFSAIYNDSDSGDIANKYRVVVYTDSGCTSSLWDSGSGGTSMSNTTQGNRSPDINFGGTPLLFEGVTYYFQIKFWDDDAAEGAFSTCNNFRMLAPGEQMKHGKYFFNNQTRSPFSWR